MKNIIAFFLQPLPVDYSVRFRRTITVLLTVVVVVYILLLRPILKIEQTGFALLFSVLGYTVITGGVLYFFFFVVYNMIDSTKWNLVKQIVTIALINSIIGFFIFLFTVFESLAVFNFENFFRFQKNAYLVGFLPSTLSILLHQSMVIKGYQKLAIQLARANETISERSNEDNINNVVRLQYGVKNKNFFIINSKEIYFFQSFGNYVRIVYKNPKTKNISIKAIRMTFNKLESSLKKYNFF